MNTKTIMGCLAVFGSAFCFYMATVIIKWSSMAGLKIDSSLFTFARFSVGFTTVLVVMGIGGHRIKIVKKRLLIGRALSNCLAVYCFFKGVELTSVAQANILNMTYPLFIAIFSWIIFKAQRDLGVIFIVLIALVGVWLILAPDKMAFDYNSLWGIGSGISAAVAIMYLNLSRQLHDIHTTLFFMFGVGTVIVFCLFYNQMHIPRVEELNYLFWCSAVAIAGQYLLTVGLKYVTAIEGGIISSTRILLAAMLGPFIAMDHSLALSGWIGAFLIFAANVYLAARKAKG